MRRFVSWVRIGSWRVVIAGRGVGGAGNLRSLAGCEVGPVLVVVVGWRGVSSAGSMAAVVVWGSTSILLREVVEKERVPPGFVFGLAPAEPLFASCFSTSGACLRASLSSFRISCTGVPCSISGPSFPIEVAIFDASSLTCSPCCVLGPIRPWGASGSLPLSFVPAEE